MNIFKKARARFQPAAPRAQAIRNGALYLMKHIGLSGQCDCMQTSDVDGRMGYLLVVSTPQVVPYPERQELQSYFRTKLKPLAEAADTPLLLLIRDSVDARHASVHAGEVRSVRAASIISAANTAPGKEVSMESLFQAFDDVRRQRQQSRAASSNPRDVPVTDLGALPEK